MKTFPKLILAMVALLPGLAMAQSVRPTVAIVPTVNISGDKYADMVDRQKKAADRIQAEELTKRGYEVIPAERVVAALKALEIDLADEENHNRATLIRLGKELGVDTIAFTVVTDTYQKEKKAFVDTIEGYAKTKTWLIDLRGDRVLLTGKTVTGKSTANNMTGSQRQVRAVEWAIREALKEITPVAQS